MNEKEAVSLTSDYNFVMVKEQSWHQKIPGEALLLLTSVVWGTGFVAQRKAMEGMQPFAFVSLRFFLGCLVLLPFILLKIYKTRSADPEDKPDADFVKDIVVPGLVCGTFLFFGTSFQQLGIMTSSASKAGFLTSLYLVLVPIIGIFFGKKNNRWVWIGVILALMGVYFLSVSEKMTIQQGDVFLLIGTVFWALQILALDHYNEKTDSLVLSFGQFLVTAILALLIAVFTESGGVFQSPSAIGPLLYSGIVAVGLAFTLQVFGQRKVDPALSALILSLEALFALISGMIFLGEKLTSREWLGCVLLLGAVILVQIKGQQQKSLA